MDKENQLRKMWDFIKDLWQFIKKYYVAEPDPDAVPWSDVLNEAEALSLKHGAKPRTLQANLINAFLDFLDGREYEMRKGREMP